MTSATCGELPPAAKHLIDHFYKLLFILYNSCNCVNITFCCLLDLMVTSAERSRPGAAALHQNGCKMTVELKRCCPFHWGRAQASAAVSRCAAAKLHFGGAVRACGASPPGPRRIPEHRSAIRDNRAQARRWSSILLILRCDPPKSSIPPGYSAGASSRGWDVIAGLKCSISAFWRNLTFLGIGSVFNQPG